MSYTLPDLSVTVSALSVSSHFLSCCVPSFSCSYETDSADKVWETSNLEVKPPGLVLVGLTGGLKYGQYCSITCRGVRLGYLKRAGWQVFPNKMVIGLD